MDTEGRAINIEVGIEDLVVWTKASRARTPSLRTRKLVTRVLLAALTAYFVYSVIVNWGRSDISSTAAMIGAVIAVWGIHWYVWSSFAIRRQLRERYNLSRSPIELGRSSVTISPDGVDTAREECQSHLEWKAITDIEDGRDHVFIVVAPNKAVIVPKRAFPNQEDALAFAASAREYWQAALR